MSEKTDAKVVKNGSKGYGYTYSNLADLAKAGIRIPKMRVKPTELGEYIEYLDDNGEWQLGAKIVVPDMKGMNAAQAYGSALTYARRYTVQLAESVACDDDDKLENHDGAGRQAKPATRKIEFTAVWEKIKEIKTEEELTNYWNSLGLTDAQKKALQKSFAKRKEEIQNGMV